MSSDTLFFLYSALLGLAVGLVLGIGSTVLALA